MENAASSSCCSSRPQCATDAAVRGRARRGAGAERPVMRCYCSSAERRRSWCSNEGGRRSLPSRRTTRSVRGAALRAERVTRVSPRTAGAAVEAPVVRAGAVQAVSAVGRCPRVRPNPSTRTSSSVKRCLGFPLQGGCLVFAFQSRSECVIEVAVRQRTDCTSTNGIVAPRRARTQIRTAQQGSIRSACWGVIASAEG